jgi:hypothetical protein
MKFAERAGRDNSVTQKSTTRSHRTPVLMLGRMRLEPGTTGAAGFGRQMARAVVRGLKP